MARILTEEAERADGDGAVEAVEDFLERVQHAYLSLLTH